MNFWFVRPGFIFEQQEGVIYLNTRDHSALAQPDRAGAATGRVTGVRAAFLAFLRWAAAARYAA